MQQAVRVKALPQAGDFLYFSSGRERLGLIYPPPGALGAQETFSTLVWGGGDWG